MLYEGKATGEVTKEELVQQYEGWEDEVQQLLQVRQRAYFHILSMIHGPQCVDRPLFWVINELKPLSISTSGRVALTGDAVCIYLAFMT